jgi:hypothetical protein
MALSLSQSPARIAVGVQDALPRRQNRPLPIVINGAALKDEVSGHDWRVAEASNSVADCVIMVEFIFSTPTVKAKPQGHRRAFSFCKNWPGVTQPNIAKWHIIDPDRQGQSCARLLRRLRTARQNMDLIPCPALWRAGDEGFDHRCDFALGSNQIVLPQICSARPTGPDCFMGFPFGGNDDVRQLRYSLDVRLG